MLLITKLGTNLLVEHVAFISKTVTYIFCYQIQTINYVQNQNLKYSPNILLKDKYY